MRLRIFLLISVIPNTLALPLRAQQKSVGPSSAGPRPNAVRPYVACAAAALTPPGVLQNAVAPGLSPARAHDRGREDRLNSIPPPSEPDGRVSRIRLSSWWFYRREER